MGRRTFHLLRGHYSSFLALTDSCVSLSELSSTSVLPRWRSLCRLSTSPCCPPDLPDVISEDLSCDAWAPITTVCRVLIPVSSSATAAFPTKQWVGFTVQFRLSDFPAVGFFEIAAISLCSGLTFCSPLWSLLPLQFPVGQLVAFTSGQNVRRCLRTHRIY